MIQLLNCIEGVIYRFSQGLRRRSRLYSYSLNKQKIKSCNAKRGRQRERQKINRSQEPILKIQVKTRLELTLFFKNNSVNSAVCHPLLDWPILTSETLVGLLADNVGGMTSWKQIWSTKFSGKLPTYPSPKPPFCSKREVDDNVGLGEG